MSSKIISAVLLAILGEILIILGFIEFGRGVRSDTLTLNIIVTTIIYGGFYSDFVFPLVNLKDRSQKQIGSLGLRWFAISSYSIISTVLMIYFSTIDCVQFSIQLITHSMLFFLLLLGLFGASISSNKVMKVYAGEKLNRNKINEMRTAISEIQKIITSIDIPTGEIIGRIDELKEEIRFLSPSNKSEALLLENKFIEQVIMLKHYLLENPINLDQVNSNIKICEGTIRERKQVLSS